jgi:hypothetical protein
MTTLEITIYVVVGLVGLAIFFGTKWLAKKFGAANQDEAGAAFDEIDGFETAAILTYLGSSIAYDAEQNRIAIWEKKSGARLIDSNGVGSWHSGTLLTLILDRTTATPMVQLFVGASDQKPFFKVGVVDETDCDVWREILATAFGREKNREIHVRVAGLN